MTEGTMLMLPTLPAPTQTTYDVAVIGGGIVGLATARELLLRKPGLRLVLLEKEPEIAGHQTGRNSGVLHAGIYYKPGSFKAQACAAGRREMIAYCTEKGIAYDECGKLIVALDESELPGLDDLHQRGIANQVPDLERIGPEHMREIEPHVQGIGALWSPHTAIVDFKHVARSFARDVQASGGEIVTSARVDSLQDRDGGMVVSAVGQGGRIEVMAKAVIACAGLHADRVAKLSGAAGETLIIPFRGDYYTFLPAKQYLVRGLIYPVPDPRFPFLGVHFTRVINGEVWAGPNAVLAFAREGYHRSDINLRDLAGTLGYPGFHRLVARYWRVGLAEMLRDWIKALYVKQLQRYLPELTGADLTFGPSGIRAQALDSSGALVDDFLITIRGRVAHVQNAPSPAATSSLVVARMIADEVRECIGP